MDDSTPQVTLSAEAFIASKTAQWAAELAADKVRCFKDTSRDGFRCWQREAWTFLVQQNYPTSVNVVERFQLVRFEPAGFEPPEGSRVGEVEYRIGYWIVGAVGRAKG